MDISWLCIWAFRYCLGRSSYVVDDFVDDFIKNYESIPQGAKIVILKELGYALNGKKKDNSAYIFGDDCCKETWVKLYKHLSNNRG